MNVAVESMESPVGTLYLVASDKGLRGIYKKKPLRETAKPTRPALHNLVRAKRELTEYFKGKRSRFEVPLDLEGTEFQKQVWNELQKIPYGQTCSYRDIARKIRNEKAVRAVGNANGKNPVCIVVPCHRVIAADGSLGGYSGGRSMKVKLLEIERK